MSVIVDTAVRRRSESGQTLVIFAIFLVVLLGATAITVDYGSLLKVRRDYQNAADAAVLAGSVFLTRPVTAPKPIAARKAAWKSIEDQLGLTLNEDALALTDTTPASPVTDGNANCSNCDGYRLWVSTPPLGAATGYAGDYPGNNRVLFAWVEKSNSAYFSRVFGLGDRAVSAWATAGTFADRFAVITLRKNGEPGDNTKDFDIQGTNTILNVIDGDVGGNWGMAIGGGAKIQFSSTTSDTYGTYLTENVSGQTPGNGWTASQVVNAANVPQPVNYQAEVPDPNYAAPCVTYGVGGCLFDRSSIVLSGGPNLLKGTPDRIGDTCPAGSTGAARLPSGRYNNVTVPNNKCIILDPTYLPVAGRSNGIFYFTGTLKLDNSALVIGQGVTIVFAPTGDLTLNAGPLILLNNDPTGCAGGPCKFGAWTTKGRLNWTTGDAPNPPTISAPPDRFDRGIAAYVFGTKTNGRCSSPTNIVKVNSAGSAIDFRGLIYAPCDNVKLSGNPTHHDLGQIVSWSLTLTGGAALTQTYDGPDSGTPVLLEPRLGHCERGNKKLPPHFVGENSKISCFGDLSAT